MVVTISKARLAVLALIFATSFAAIGAGVALASQPHMVNARNYLNQALSELNAANPDKGGHRVSAINLIKQAITQVNEGIQYAQ